MSDWFTQLLTDGEDKWLGGLELELEELVETLEAELPGDEEADW